MIRVYSLNILNSIAKHNAEALGADVTEKVLLLSSGGFGNSVGASGDCYWEVKA